MRLQRTVLFPAALALVLSLDLTAATVRQMNLSDLCQGSEKIFRGTILDFNPGVVEAGGGKIPIVTYRIRLHETLKGVFPDHGFLEIRMLGELKRSESGSVKRNSLFKDLPRLKVGHDYVLFTTRESALGLSTTVGLGQGSFEVIQIDKRDFVVNGLNNHGLFRGMDSLGAPQSGPVGYSQLVDRVKSLLAR